MNICHDKFSLGNKGLGSISDQGDSFLVSVEHFVKAADVKRDL